MQELLASISQVLAPIQGRMSVTIRDYKSGEEIGILSDEPLPMASVCKTPILIAALRAVDSGHLDLEERVELGPKQRTFGSGLFNHFRDGLQPTIYDCLLMMIVVSDNAATDIILRKLPPEAVTLCMTELGFPEIKVNRTIRNLIGDILAALDPRFEGVEFDAIESLEKDIPELDVLEHDLIKGREAVNSACEGKDIATTRSLAKLMCKLCAGELATPIATEAMIKILNTQQLNGRLPRDLPAFTKFPHKTGTLGSGAVVNDVGMLYLNDEPVAAIAALSRDVRNPIHETNTALAQVGQAVHEYYRSKQ